jgi:hypothetical protein
MNNLSIRITVAHSDISKIIQFLDHPKMHYYVYCFEVGKKLAEHWHIQLKTDLHCDTVRKRIYERIWPCLDPSKYSCKHTKQTLPRAIAYLFKEQNYTIHWDNNDEIDQAHQIYNDFQEEVKLPTLKLKCLAHLKTLTPVKDNYMSNTMITHKILKWFKDKELNYPSQTWLKNCIITYWMDIHKNQYTGQGQDHIDSIYSIRNPYYGEDNDPLKFRQIQEIEPEIII